MADEMAKSRQPKLGIGLSKAIDGTDNDSDIR
jgi:hypothetical protein